MTYEELSEKAKIFLAHCGQFTVSEHDRFEEDLSTSVNEILGMAVRILAEQSNALQILADSEDPQLNGGHNG